MKNHVMLDLETLSTRKDAAIIQLAARAFDPETGELGSAFSVHIKPETGHIDPMTVAWWLQQNHAPAIGRAMTDGMTETEALSRFAHWYKHLYVTNDVAAVALWSHGATFDIVLLEGLYTRHGREKPWSYKAERDTRTLYAWAPGGMPKVDVDPNRVHDAAYDCDVQIQQVVGALRALRG